jgi:Fe-S cluster assembly iron-binding protein IscA
MLELTDATVSYLKALLPLDSDPATAIRIEPSHNSSGDALITFRPVKRPHQGDVKALATDLDVFVAPEVAETLASSVLDAAPHEAGRLVLLAQVVPV